MAAYTIVINSAGVVQTAKLSPRAGDTVTWSNQGTTVTISFSSSWPFTGNATSISVPASGNSSSYTVKSTARNENDGYVVSRDGKTTGSGEIDLGAIDDYPNAPIP